ncbi:hypothetical protein [Micromonospora sp. ALFpr18c]|nr:hypothetical protein [Micromonospora sp. ALFpr18c]
MRGNAWRIPLPVIWELRLWGLPLDEPVGAESASVVADPAGHVAR